MAYVLMPQREAAGDESDNQLHARLMSDIAVACVLVPQRTGRTDESDSQVR
jgi:hypothetical protein